MALKPKDAPDLSRFDWEDAFRMEDQLSEEERMLRDGADPGDPARAARRRRGAGAIVLGCCARPARS